MFSWISKLARKPHQTTDPDFGNLTYLGGYWEGKGAFPATGSEVEYFVIAGEHGPSSENRKSLRHICDSYDELSSRAATAISIAAGTATKVSDLVISSLDVPSGDLDGSVWEMSFSCTNGTQFCVEFSGLETTGQADTSY